ncbi:MAG: hypothetical protein JWP97_5930 [Labilithrix sp.]|nr:hypothetical protein [Labilithrix sp.]
MALYTPPRTRDRSRMTAGWNFERRRDTCNAFAIGVFVLAKGLPDRATSLEAVRNRMQLSPEEALFAARKLDEELRISFDPAGGVRSNANGIAHADALMGAVRAKLRSFDEVTRALHAGGSARAVVIAAARTNGNVIECAGPPSAVGVDHRLVLEDARDVLVLERLGQDGSFEAAPVEE